MSIVSGRILVHDESATSFGFIGAKCFAVPAGSGASVSCKYKSPTIFHADLGDGDDTISGAGLPQNVRLDVRTGDGNNTVVGGNGNDVVRGQASATGSDFLDAGPGNDRLTAGTGTAQMLGGDGNDVFVGGPGVDFVNGGDGDDYVRSGGGTDTIFGGDGNDGLSGDGGNDYISGAAGNDHVYGGEGDDLLNGGFGRDVITGNKLNDWVRARDTFRDTVKCGGGDDVATTDTPTFFLGIQTGGDATHQCENVISFGPTDPPQ